MTRSSITTFSAARAPFALCAAAVAGALALAGCGGPAPAAPSSAPAAPGTVPVVASTDVYGSIANAVGGQHVKVTSLIHSPDVDPHEYEATASDGAAAGKAKVMIENGGGYDDFASKLAQVSGGNATVINVTQLSGLPTGPDFNEHVWYHLPTMAKLADRLAAELGKADPADAAAFQANATAFKGKLDGLSAKINAIKTGHPGARVAITEPVPLYLVQAAGLTNATPEEFSSAVEQGNDPPAAVLNKTLALFSGPGKVSALLSNAQTESPATQQVEQAAARGGVPVVKVTETLPAGTMDYVTWMGRQIDALAGALDRG
jgi:zinc/manganese transport system substrate-binding protein